MHTKKQNTITKPNNTQSQFFKVGTKLLRGKIIPVFLPFAGCPFKCLYCAQDTQTGVGEQSIAHALETLYNDIAHITKKKNQTHTKESLNEKTQNLTLQNVPMKNVPVKNVEMEKIEIAFYGGTFTALSDVDFEACLTAFSTCKSQLIKAGYAVFGRCSTRPDCVHNNARLKHMKEVGIDLIELGIQSFDNTVLSALGRGYTNMQALEACKFIQSMGFFLGIQLMPSSPKQDVRTFHADVETAISLKPTCMRYYPCLVLKNTPLAKLYQEKSFDVWSLEACVEALGFALYRAWVHEVALLRLSVAYEENFDKTIIAGVRHPALGSLIQARALRYAFKKNTAHTQSLHVPKHFQGFIFGEKNALKKEWAQDIPIKNIFFDSHASELKKIIPDFYKETTQKKHHEYINKIRQHTEQTCNSYNNMSNNKTRNAYEKEACAQAKMRSPYATEIETFYAISKENELL